MLPLRGFTLTSNVLGYNAAMNADVFFSSRLQPNTRAGIIGFGFDAVDLTAGLTHSLDRFEVAGRIVKQGDRLPFGLLASGAVPVVGGTELENLQARFPGSRIPLSDGKYCSAILLNGRENIRMTLTNLDPAPGAPLIRTVQLYCVEFPRGAYPAGLQARIEELWDQFKSGIGQFHCFSNQYALLAGATALQVQLENMVNPPHSQNSRRMEARGLELDDGAPGLVSESTFRAATAQFFGSTQTAHSNGGVPARSILGHANLHHRDQIADDYERDSRSIALFTHPANLLASNLTGFVVTCFEGTDRQGIKLCGPSVF